MNKKLLGISLFASSATLLGGCGILETVEVPQFRFDSNSYVVQPGDTLQSVASRYSIDPDSLMAVNSLQLASLVPGQRLTLLRNETEMSGGSMRDTRLSDVQGAGVAGAVGQPVMIPNATQTASEPATVRPVIETEAISTDLILAPTGSEEIVKVVDASAPPLLDELLDDQPVASVERPEGVETIIQTVDASSQPIAELLPVPSAGAVSILDSDTDTAVKRITVNNHADGWNWPAIGTITKEFDLREINRQGLDIDPGPGAGVQAAADGEVVYSGRDLASYGNLVILRHEGNFLSAYSKVSDIFVTENQKVKAGELIASVGSDQNDSTELHFEIRRNGEPVNPIDYLPAL